MRAPLAYLLTWTCHGTWLHGDPRGSVDAKHNALGTPRLGPDPDRRMREESLMHDSDRTAAPVSLLLDSRSVIDSTIRRHCEIRNWRLLALNVRTNHIHVVVDCRGRSTPETAMEQFKAWCTRRLREAGLVPSAGKVWTEHGSTRWIDTPESLELAIDYVLNRQ